MTKRHALRATLPIALVAMLAGGTCGDQPAPTPPDGPDPGGDLSGSVLREGIEYRADLLVMESFPVQLRARTFMKNRTGESRTITFRDGCVTLMRAYRAGGGEPVWDQAKGTGCTMALVPFTLGPGEERELPVTGATAYDILGAELPDGPYRITVYLRPVDGPEVEIGAGTTELAIPR